MADTRVGPVRLVAANSCNKDIQCVYLEDAKQTALGVQERLHLLPVHVLAVHKPLVDLRLQRVVRRATWRIDRREREQRRDEQCRYGNHHKRPSPAEPWSNKAGNGLPNGDPGTRADLHERQYGRALLAAVQIAHHGKREGERAAQGDASEHAQDKEMPIGSDGNRGDARCFSQDDQPAQQPLAVDPV